MQWDTIATRSSDITALLTIYRDVLDATVTTDGDSTICTWPSGTITIESADRSGIDGVRFHRDSTDEAQILSPPW